MLREPQAAEESRKTRCCAALSLARERVTVRMGFDHQFSIPKTA